MAFASATVLVAAAENIDPAGDGSQYAWAENVGWLSAEMDTDHDGTPDEGVEVRDFELLGWMWGENVGWVSLSCKNTGSCWADYGVRNDGQGFLHGFAWAENVGWIDFAPTDGGVRIHPGTGEFEGEAWGENIGWIRFASNGPHPFRLTTDWRCDPPPGSPLDPVDLRLYEPGPETWLEWTPVSGATGWDVVFGYLDLLRATLGDFEVAAEGCLADNQTEIGLAFADLPAPGDAYWFLVRPANCGGPGTYDSLGPMQIGGRDAEINASTVSCR
jgi:hypothetical protein